MVTFTPALGERVSGEGARHAAAHERREWEAMRGTLERAEEPNGGAEGAEGADSAAGFGPDGAPARGVLGRGPETLRRPCGGGGRGVVRVRGDGRYLRRERRVVRRGGLAKVRRPAERTGQAAALREAAGDEPGGDGERAAADFVLQCAETCYADASTRSRRRRTG